jgi:hypothetical protein
MLYERKGLNMTCPKYCALLIVPMWYLQDGNFAERSCMQWNPALLFRKNCIEITNFSLWLARLICVIRRLKNAITLRHQVRWLIFPLFSKRQFWGRTVRSVTPGLFMSSFWIKNHSVGLLDAEISLIKSGLKITKENLSSTLCSVFYSVPNWRRGRRYKIARTRLSGRGIGARLRCTCFCLSRQYHSLSIVQINPLRPSTNHSAPGSQYFWISLKNMTCPPLFGSRKFISLAPKPL